MTTGGVSSGTLDTSVVANLLLDPSRNSDMGKFAFWNLQLAVSEAFEAAFL